MLNVRPGQTWQRRSIPGAPWRPVEVINVLFDAVELRFLDLPHAPDLERTFATSRSRLLAGGGQGIEYRYASG
jgi:hypothetical protein